MRIFLVFSSDASQLSLNSLPTSLNNNSFALGNGNVSDPAYLSLDQLSQISIWCLLTVTYPWSFEWYEYTLEYRQSSTPATKVSGWLGRDGWVDDGANTSNASVSNSGSGISLSIKHAIGERITEWREGRKKKGGQVRSTEVEPWRDDTHRQYFVALAPPKRGANRKPSWLTEIFGRRQQHC